MRKITLNKKMIVAAGICFGLAGALFINSRQSIKAADMNDTKEQVEVSYHQCESTMEEILDEDVCEAISVLVVQEQEEGRTCEVSDAVEVENGYYHIVEKEEGTTAIAGITLEDKSYIVTIDSEGALSEEAVADAIADFQDRM